MNKFILAVVALTLPCAAVAQNAASGSPRTQGVPDGYGDPVQVTLVGPNGADLTASTAPFTVPRGTSTLTSGQVSCATTSTQVAAARTGRARITLTSTAATVYYVGVSGVTTATGLYVGAAAGASVTLNTSAAVFCVVASGTLTVSYIEEY